MTSTWSGKGKGKARADSPNVPPAAGASRLTPPRTPPRQAQPLLATPSKRSAKGLPVTPSRLSVPSTPSSKRTSSQARLTDFFYSPKKLRQPELTFEEKKAKREVEEIVLAVHKDAEKEGRESKQVEAKAARDAKAAERQLKREERQAAEEQKKKKAQPNKDWQEWRKQNSKLGVTFKLPASYNRDSYRNVKQCKEEFNLTPAELRCLEYCYVPNTVNKEWADEKWYRLDDVWDFVGRKTAMLAGVVMDDEDDLILMGRVLFIEQQATRECAKET